MDVMELAGAYTNVEPMLRPGRVGGDACCAHVGGVGRDILDPL